MKYTQNFNLRKPEGTDLVNIDDLNYNVDVIDTELAKRIINAGNVPSIQAGLDASKPAPGTVGRLYVATDTQILYRDTGTAWQKVGVVKWDDIEGKPSSFTPSAHKSTHAIGGSDALSPTDIGAETPAGAQAKANQAEANAKAYTDQQISAITPEQIGAETPAGAQAKVDAHAADSMPHRTTDPSTGKVYRWGLAVQNGELGIIYEEVV